MVDEPDEEEAIFIASGPLYSLAVTINEESG